MPDGCIANETCQAIVTVLVEDEERYEFELQSGVGRYTFVIYTISVRSTSFVLFSRCSVCFIRSFKRQLNG